MAERSRAADLCPAFLPWQQLNMQPQVVNEYESGKAIPNNAIIAKFEKALGCKLPRVAKAKKTAE